MRPIRVDSCIFNNVQDTSTTSSHCDFCFFLLLPTLARDFQRSGFRQVLEAKKFYCVLSQDALLLGVAEIAPLKNIFHGVRKVAVPVAIVRSVEHGSLTSNLNDSIQPCLFRLTSEDNLFAFHNLARTTP